MKLPSYYAIKTPFLTEEECQSVVEYAHKKEEELKQNHRPDETTQIVGPQQITTLNSQNYNFFYDNQHLIPRLSDVLDRFLPWMTKPLMIQSWVNIYRKGEGIKWHNHIGFSDHSYTANIFVGGEREPGLIIGELGNGGAGGAQTIPNTLGEMIIMNCNLMHMVSPLKTNTPRYTIGMTIHDFNAITPSNLYGCAINSPSPGQILIV